MKKLTDLVWVWVSPQLTLVGLRLAKKAGIRSVINNRPDGEATTQTSSKKTQRRNKNLVSSTGIFLSHQAISLTTM